ncbi:hypothetical protein GOODEAATRI_007600, partial [Goodea atripinnis]
HFPSVTKHPPKHLDFLSKTWLPTATQLTTVTGKKAKMQVKKMLRNNIQCKGWDHMFWLAPIHPRTGFPDQLGGNSGPHQVSPFPGHSDRTPTDWPPGETEAAVVVSKLWKKVVEVLQTYNFKIQHQPGKQRRYCDALS